MTKFYNLDAEKNILGAMMLTSSDVAEDAMAELQADCFYDERNQYLFMAIAHLLRKGNTPDIVSVDVVLTNRGYSSKCSKQYIMNVMTSVVTATNYEYHVGIVKDLWKKRNLDSLLDSASRQLNEFGSDFDSIATEIAESANKLLIDNRSRRTSFDAKDYIHDVVEEINHNRENQDQDKVGWNTFYNCVNIRCKPKPGHFWLIGARPSCGKTSFALNLTFSIAFLNGIQVDYLNAEDHPSEHYQRLLGILSGVPMKDFQQGSAIAEAHERIERAKYDIENTLFRIEDVRAKGIRHIISYIRKRAREGVNVFCMDFLQKIRRVKGESDKIFDRISLYSMELSALAAELDICIIGLSQLNRDKDVGNAMPTLRNLKGSGNLEEDSHFVILLHQNNAEDVPERKARIIFAKNKFGPTGEERVKFVTNITRFEEYSAA